MFLWRILYPLKDDHEKEFNEIQPSYKHCRIRHQLMIQVRNSHVKLRRTHILINESYGNTTRRSATVKKRAKLLLQPIIIPSNPSFLYGFNI